VYLSQLRQFYWELRGLGVELVAAANDTPETNEALRRRYELPFSLLSDENGDVARAYGAFHEDEPQGRSIARVSVFLIEQADAGGRITWEYVGPTARHRVALSRLSEEVQRMQGLSTLTVSVVVPSTWHLEQTIAGFQNPPLGIYTTPDDLNEPGVLVYRDYMRELAMQSHAEVHRLANEGWQLMAVTPESENGAVIGQRHVFQRSGSPETSRSSRPVADQS
jgi:alkyl hydroperoxide reductase subunit AhpC